MDIWVYLIVAYLLIGVIVFVYYWVKDDFLVRNVLLIYGILLILLYPLLFSYRITMWVKRNV